MSFAQLIAGAEPLEGGFRLAVPEDWHQGRTAYGGFSSAVALAAAVQLGDDLPPLRSAQIAMIAPVHGEVEVRARQLRRGRNATWISAEILKDGAVGLIGNFVFMGPTTNDLHLNDRPAPAGLIPVEQAQPFDNPRAPIFLRSHFDVRFALPRGDGPRNEICWWVRPRERDGLDPMVELLLTADALPPGVMSLFAPTTLVSTMHWQVNLLTPAPVTRDGWWLLRSTGDYAELGCSSQGMEIWNADGVPVQAGVQSIALFG